MLIHTTSFLHFMDLLPVACLARVLNYTHNLGLAAEKVVKTLASGLSQSSSKTAHTTVALFHLLET